MANYQLTEAKDRLNWAIWRQWIVANALAEMIGLGTSALLWGAFAYSFSAEELLGVLTSTVVVVLGSTLLEGTAVGVGQWLVLRRPLPQLTWQAWVLATMVGAFVAWSLGMIPSTMMTLGEETSSQPPLEINDLVMYSLAAVMGLVLGPILGLPQWWVLRRHLRHAVWWVPANAVAWAIGMIAIFVGVSFVPESGLTFGAVLVVLLSLATAGALVGAVHGWVLIWLLKENKT